MTHLGVVWPRRETIGTGGRTVDKLIKYDLQDIGDKAPNVVIQDIGSNDLCDEQSDPDTVALSIIALVEILITDLKLRCLVLCQVLPRKKTKKTNHLRNTTKGFGN